MIYRVIRTENFGLAPRSDVYSEYIGNNKAKAWEVYRKVIRQLVGQKGFDKNSQTFFYRSDSG